MRRRNDGSATEGFVLIASLLPWWVCLIMAGLSLLIFHEIAGSNVEPPTEGTGLTAYGINQLFVVFALFGQIVVPSLFIIAAMLSAKQRGKDCRTFREKIHKPAFVFILILTQVVTYKF